MKCIVCGNDSWIFLFKANDRMLKVPGIFSEYRCKICGLVRLSPVPKNLKKYYPSKNYYSYAPSSRKSFFGWLRSFLIEHNLLSFVPAMPQVMQKGRILDIGCGSGDTLALLSGLGWETYGMDIDKRAIAAAKRRGLTHVKLGTYKDLKTYPDNFFDAIRLYHVIEHLDDPNFCLTLAHKKLKKGGQIIIGTPNVSSLVAKIFRDRWYNLDAPRHLYLFSPKTLTKLVKTNELKNIKISFSSAGGWVGSVQYILGGDLINKQWLVMLFYPLEWILDRLRLGDVFVLRAQKL